MAGKLSGDGVPPSPSSRAPACGLFLTLIKVLRDQQLAGSLTFCSFVHSLISLRIFTECWMLFWMLGI
jgi:hypothetical protein